MQWGTNKRAARDNKEECHKLEALLQPYKDKLNFPRIFSEDDKDPTKPSCNKLGAMDVNTFSKFTRASFAAQVIWVGQKMLREDKRRGNTMFYLIVCAFLPKNI